jgi:signal transduction histidine kinase/DNA-binding response OmpR family regulator/ligand-binding sensor domain-containing protein
MNKKFKLFILLIFYLGFSIHVSAVKFYSVNSLFGISMREANSVCKDNNGFIWASSKTGILRMSYGNYRLYHLPYEVTSVMSVKLIYEYSKLIAYTNNGQVFLYNPVYDRFELKLNLSKELNNKYLSIKGLLLDEQGGYWIASATGFYKFQSGKLSLSYEISSERYSITWFDKQHIIIVRKEGIWLLDIKTLKSKCVYKNNLIFPFLASSLYFDKNQNKLWIGTNSNGLFCFDFDSKSFSSILNATFPRQPILSIEENSDSTLLFGIDGQGIWEITKRNKLVTNVYKENADDPSSLRGNGVYDLFCDNNRRVWICTYSGGLSFFDQASTILTQIIHHTNNDNSLINNEVNSILEYSYGKIWFATNNGISCWNTLLNQWKSYYSNKLEQAQVFLTLCKDDKGQIWAGTYSSGVYILDEMTGKELAHFSHNDKSSPIVSNFIAIILKDSQGNIWLGGSSDELICYLSKENKFRTYSKEPISSIIDISPNQILLGCSYGLSLLNKQTGEIKKLILGSVVQDILKIEDDIWVCTSGDGLLKYSYKDGKTEKFTTKSGLPSNFLNSIIHDDNYLWLGTESGLCRFNLKDKTILTFSSIIQLSGIAYNRHSHCKLRNGQFAWGTNNGVIIFKPNTLSEVRSFGKIFFEDLYISGRSIRDIPTFNLKSPIDSLKSIKLKYSQNTISLQVIPLGTSGGSKFSWKIEGFDKDWTPPSENRMITYTNIPSGELKLRIKLYNNSLSQVLSERFITISVIPPFWKTGWFWILVSVIILGIIFLYLLYHINFLKQKHSIEKIRFFTNTAHEIRNSLTLIRAPVEELNKEKNLTESGQYFLSLAIEQARRLSSVVTQLLNFQKMDIGKEQMFLSMIDIVKMISSRSLMFESFSKSKNIDVVFSSDQKSFVTAIDESKIEKVIDNLISNAIKYSHSGDKVYVDLKCENKKWVLQIRDQGIGISKKGQRQLFNEFHRGENAINAKIVGSGIGLILVKNYVKMHGGKISCESQENIGSIFRVVIPIKEVSNVSSQYYAFIEQRSNNDSANNNLQTAVVQDTNTANEMTVLIVEDNDELLDFMHRTLKREFKVFTAENGEKAWEFIADQVPDLIVSDVMMPYMDGFELCKLIKSTYETSHIPVILLTGLSDKGEQLHGLGLGADDYLIKPFDMNLLMQKIKTIIQNREAVKEKALKLFRGNINEPILTNELNDKFVKRMLEVAKTNISNSEFNKEIFASEMNVSPSLLYKKIKSITDQSPTDFIKIIRLDRSMELLQTRKYSITEVSELCGFTSVGYFSTVFKKHFGKPPAKILE